MTSFFADTLAFSSHLPGSVFAFFASSRPFLNSSITPVCLSKDELWNALVNSSYPNPQRKQIEYFNLFINFSDTMQFTETLRFDLDHNDKEAQITIFRDAMKHLITKTRYFTRTLKMFVLPDPDSISHIITLFHHHLHQYQQQQSFSNVRSIEFASSNSNIGLCLTDAHLEYICEIFPFLDRLDLSSFGDEITDDGLASISNLKLLESELNLQNLTQITRLPFLNDCSKLRALNLTKCVSLRDAAFSVMMLENSSLRKINFEGCDGITCRTFQKLSRLPNLEELTVSHVTSETIEAIGGIKHLVSLQLLHANNPMITEESVTSCFSRLCCLVSLSVTYCSLVEVMDRLLLELANNNSTLRKLKIAACHFTDETLVQFAKTTSSPIEVLQLFNNTGMTDSALCGLTELQHLETIEIAGNRSLTGDLFLSSDGNNNNNKDDSDARSTQFSSTLKNIRFASCFKLSGFAVEKIVKPLSLYSMQLICCDDIGSLNGVLAALAENSASTLHTLMTTDNSIVDMRMFGRFENLKKLVLERSMFLSKSQLSATSYSVTSTRQPKKFSRSKDDQIISDRNSMSSIESLTLYDSSSLLDQNLVDMLCLLTNLRELNLRNCPMLSSVAAKQGVSKLKSLRQVDLASVRLDFTFVSAALEELAQFPFVKTIKLCKNHISRVQGIPALSKSLEHIRLVQE